MQIWETHQKKSKKKKKRENVPILLNSYNCKKKYNSCVSLQLSFLSHIMLETQILSYLGSQILAFHTEIEYIAFLQTRITYKSGCFSAIQIFVNVLNAWTSLVNFGKVWKSWLMSNQNHRKGKTKTHRLYSEPSGGLQVGNATVIVACLSEEPSQECLGTGLSATANNSLSICPSRIVMLQPQPRACSVWQRSWWMVGESRNGNESWDSGGHYPPYVLEEFMKITWHTNIFLQPKQDILCQLWDPHVVYQYNFQDLSPFSLCLYIVLLSKKVKESCKIENLWTLRKTLFASFFWYF